MTSFHEIRFPEDIAYGSDGGPEYSTDVTVTQGGHEKRNVNWDGARLRYNVAYGVQNQNQLNQLVAFFRARKGRAYGFRFKDWADYSASTEHIGVGDGSKTLFQLIKTYESGNEEEVRAITKPVDGTVKVYVDAQEQSSGLRINYSTGVLTFETAPEVDVAITADFEFDVPVRFDSDRLSAILEDFGTYAVRDVILLELR